VKFTVDIVLNEKLLYNLEAWIAKLLKEVVLAYFKVYTSIYPEELWDFGPPKYRQECQLLQFDVLNLKILTN
jgi:hypothetical protein